MRHALPARNRLYPLIYLLVITTGALALWIATTTRPNTHPDEVIHVDAFCYFESHWWPPPLNYTGLRYSPDGWSRVYSGELVYILFGQLAVPLRPWLGTPAETLPLEMMTAPQRLWLPILFNAYACTLDYRIYRLLNVALWIITISVLFALGRRQRIVAAWAFLLCSLPQVIYMYAYANSDAWALTISSLLFAVTVTRTAVAPPQRRDVLLFGFLIGLALLAKPSLWPAIPFCVAVWWVRTVHRDPITTGATVRRTVLQLAVVAGVALLVALPLLVIYPLSQPDYAQQVEAMREDRARWDFMPSNPTNPGYRLAAKGVPVTAVLTGDWMLTSLESLYGYFGYYTLRLPLWIHISAATLTGLAILATLVDFVRRRQVYLRHEKLLLAVIPLFIALPLVASLVNSWTYDLQPQGRYLFAALLPLAWLLAGVSATEPPMLRRVRAAIWVALLLLSHYALYTQFVLVQPLA